MLFSSFFKQAIARSLSRNHNWNQIYYGTMNLSRIFLSKIKEKVVVGGIGHHVHSFHLNDVALSASSMSLNKDKTSMGTSRERSTEIPVLC